ncbi:hypothetical protein [Desulfonatronovibrio hydrogenovorans]|uniref:hypothetical protein n=1 Tax=Desulfonatronovibrio hydrogenovorans TaxID=53245 RepID=UPI00048C9133|nr:hypothetical protein [Desulfonatronovibrio hydrogenovorans]
MKTSVSRNRSGRKRLGPAAVALIILGAMVVSVIITLLVAKTWLYPSPIKPVDLNAQEQAILEAKLESLPGSGRSVQEHGQDAPGPEPYRESPEHRVIYFTQRELNAMVDRNPDLAGRVALHLSEGMVSATMLVTMPKDMPMFAGRTVKVSTGLHLDYQQGRPVITLDGVSIMGVPVPSAWLGGFKGRDMVAFYGADEGFWSIFSRGVKDLKVEQGRLRVELAE